MGILDWLRLLRHAQALLDFQTDHEGFRTWCRAVVAFATDVGDLLNDPLWLEKITALVRANVETDATYDALYELVSLFLRQRVGADGQPVRMPWWLSVIVPVIIELIKKLFDLQKNGDDLPQIQP